MVTFGDSYTDDSRLEYFINHNGTAPPPGIRLPENPLLRNWAKYVTQYTGLVQHNYAVSGAVCSNKITPRPFPLINADFPSVLEYEIPAYLADVVPESNIGRHSAVYAIFIGVNDLGNVAFLTDSQVSGKLLHDYTRCLFAAIDQLHTAGGRHFLLFNAIPLHLAPQYTGSTHATRYFPDKPSNISRLSLKMQQQTTSINEILRYQVPYEVLVSKRYPDSNVALFDTSQLLSDIFEEPTIYLNGSQPVSVHDWEHHCEIDGTGCSYKYDRTSSDSFMWWDELHPSEQVHRILASEVVQTLEGRSQYASYWSS